MPARSYCGPVHLWLWVRNCQSYNVNCYALQVVATVGRHVRCSLLCFVSVIVFYIYFKSAMWCGSGGLYIFNRDSLPSTVVEARRHECVTRQRVLPVAVLPSPPSEQRQEMSLFAACHCYCYVCSDALTIVFCLLPKEKWNTSSLAGYI